MLAVIDWNEVLSQALIWSVIGAVGGGFAAILLRKPGDKKRSEAETLDRTRPHAESGPGKTASGLLLFFAVLAVTFAAVAVYPSLIAPHIPGGSDRGKPGAAGGESKPIATISDYGRYRNKGQVRVTKDRSASAGVSVASDHDLILLEQTDQISCRVGETWGFRIRCSGVPANRPYTVRKETYHPPIEQPDGSVRTKDVYEVTVRPDRPPDHFCGWYFLKGYENELVAGEWRVVVFVEDVEVASKSFTIRR